jgi:NADH-quinone oxidoreductase subunit G
MTTVLAQVLKALATAKQATLNTSVQQIIQSVTPSAIAQAIADSLASGERVAIFLGNFAQQHPQASQLQLLAQHIAALCGATFGFFGEAANSVGGYLAQAVPFASAEHGMNASAMLAAPRKAYILLNVEAELDMHNPQQALAAMGAADMVVALSAYKHHATEYADVLLPITPFTETSGTFISSEGRVQSFKGTVQPLGESRPAWKVLRVLGNMLDIPGFDYNNSEAVRDEVLAGTDLPAKLGNVLHGVSLQAANWEVAGLQRVSDVPIYATDAIVRRAASLQKTRDAAAPRALMHSVELKKLNLQSGEMIKLTQEHGSARLSVIADDSLPHGVVRVAAGHAVTAELGAMFGAIMVERA